MFLVLAGLLALSAVGTSEIAKDADDPEFLSRAKEVLERLNARYAEWGNKQMVATWDYETNITIESELNLLNPAAQFDDFVTQVSREINNFPWREIKDSDTRRQFEMMAPITVMSPSAEGFIQFVTIINKMPGTLAKGKICDFHNPNKCDLSLQPEIEDIFTNSRDPEELKHVWTQWRDVSGKQVKEDFVRYVELSNEIARFSNYTDMAAFWLGAYETDDIVQQIETLWTELKPLYLQLHAYVRRQLRMKYGEDIVSKDGPIPAHLFGTVYSQSWTDVAEFSMPYPNTKKFRLGSNAVRIIREMNVTKMFRMAEDFYVSLNLSAMPETFWNNSIFEKRKGVEMNCHPKAWDFYDGKDFRIKMCTRIDLTELPTIYHEMGHVQYFIQYKDLPTAFKDGANPAFHEAVGDTMALSATTPGYFKNLGVLDDAIMDHGDIINNLYINGLSKIASLPFSYRMDKWRWGIFQGTIPADQYNCKWWSLAEELQGIEPPVDRSENDFDPGAIQPMVAGIDYVKYYLSFIIQFQFHKALCIEAGQYDPSNPQSKRLVECNIYGSKKAGRLLKSMLELGSSKPWPDAMEKITGQRKIDSSGLLEYFQPLMEWLKEENKKTNEYIGWKPSKRVCRGKNTTNGTQDNSDGSNAKNEARQQNGGKH